MWFVTLRNRRLLLWSVEQRWKGWIKKLKSLRAKRCLDKTSKMLDSILTDNKGRTQQANFLNEGSVYRSQNRTVLHTWILSSAPSLVEFGDSAEADKPTDRLYSWCGCFGYYLLAKRGVTKNSQPLHYIGQVKIQETFPRNKKNK